MKAHRRHVRTGYVLILVLGFAALVTLLGAAYLESHSTAATQAGNLRAAAQAEYLAASGVAIAAHYLNIPPTAVAVGDYWRGVNGLSIDGTSDYCNVSVQISATEPELFSVTATGVVRDNSGAVVAQRTTRSDVLTPPPYSRVVSRAMVANASPTIPAPVRIYGHLHANGSIDSGAYCSGAVSATGTIKWTNSTPPASITPGAGSVSMPPYSTTMWNRYVVHGVPRAAASYSSTSLTPLAVGAAGGQTSFTIAYQSDGSVIVVDALGLLSGSISLGRNVTIAASAVGLPGLVRSGASLVSTNNPGGVLVKSGNLSAGGMFNYVGTLVVTGDLTISNDSIIGFYAMPGYPALVVSGRIRIGDRAIIVVRGPVQCNDRFENTRPNLTVYGAFLSYAGEGMKLDFASLGSADFNWDSRYSTIYDFTVFQPTTLLNWNES